MAHQINELIEKIKELEEEIEVEFQKKREDIHWNISRCVPSTLSKGLPRVTHDLLSSIVLTSDPIFSNTFFRI